MNVLWSPQLSLFEIEYNTVYAALLSILFSFCIVLSGYFSKNKYAMLGSFRCCVLTLNLELLMGLFILNVSLFGQSFSFSYFFTLQETLVMVFVFGGFLSLICILFLLETNRAPFDLTEAESELVSGYSTEYGAFYFALYYLGEYLHLFFFSAILTSILLGG
jgi:NADH:ubiquinone oxidoreductase subunit H